MSRKLRLLRRMTFGLCWLFGSACSWAHPLSVEDLLSTENVQRVIPSPNGRFFAIVVQRKYGTGEGLTFNLFWQPRCDIWIVAPGGLAWNLTKGTNDGSTSFAPLWSPDSRHLAFLSDKRANNINMFVWTVGRPAAARLSIRGIDLSVNFGSVSPTYFTYAAWINDSHVLAVVLPFGEAPVGYRYDLDMKTAIDAWAAARAGREATASALGTGANTPQPKRYLVDFNIRNAETKQLGSALYQSITLSPDHKWIVAAIDDGPTKVVPGELTQFVPLRTLQSWLEYRKSRLRLIRTSDGWARNVVGIKNPMWWSTTGLSRWSSDSSAFAILASSSSNTPLYPAPTELFKVDAPDGRVTPLGSGFYDFNFLGSQLLGLKKDGLYAASREGGLARIATVTPALPEKKPFSEPVVSLFPSPIGMVGIVNNRLSILDQNLRSFTPIGPMLHVDSIMWPSAAKLAKAIISKLVVRAGDHLWLVDLSSSSKPWLPLRPPSLTSVFSAYAPHTSTIAYVDKNSAEEDLWVGRISASPQTKALVLDRHWKSIDDPAERLIRYRTSSGSLIGILYLPPGYHGGIVPVIVNVYPGLVFSEKNHPDGASKSDADWMNFAKYTSAGFAVFAPSIPLAADGGDFADQLLDKVVPGIRKLIQMGIARQGRIGLRGNSYGSLAALTILERTDLFSAAVTSANYADLSAFHNYFHPETRYDPLADSYRRQNFAETEAPNGLLRLMATPDANIDKYIYNSPLYHADKIHTPLLIIHGDFDAVPIQGAEALYTMVRQSGTPVQFVRYWGEAHNIRSPANIRDEWKREIGWYKKYLIRGTN